MGKQTEDIQGRLQEGKAGSVPPAAVIQVIGCCLVIQAFPAQHTCGKQMCVCVAKSKNSDNGMVARLLAMYPGGKSVFVFFSFTSSLLPGPGLLLSCLAFSEKLNSLLRYIVGSSCLSQGNCQSSVCVAASTGKGAKLQI